MIGKWLGQGGKLGKLDGMGDSGAQKIRYQERIWRMGRNPVWFGYFVYFTFLHLVIIAFCGDTVISLNFGTEFEEIVAQKYSPFHYNMCFSTVACFFGVRCSTYKNILCVSYMLCSWKHPWGLGPCWRSRFFQLMLGSTCFFWGRMGIGFEWFAPNMFMARTTFFQLWKLPMIRFFGVPWLGIQFWHQTEGKSRQSRYGEVGCCGDVETKSGNLILWVFVETWEPSFAHYFHTKMSTR